MPVPMKGGKQYATVQERLQAAHGEAIRPVEIEQITTSAEMVGPAAIVVAHVTFKDGRHFSGISQVQFDATSGAEKTNPVEVAETSAVGRALAMAGYFGSDDGIAGAEEMRAAESRLRQASIRESLPRKKTPREYYGELSRIATNAGHKDWPVLLALDAPDDFIIEKGKELKAKLVEAGLMK